MAIAFTWSLRSLVKMIANILENKFDCVIAIEGNRGLGKSTLAYWIAKKLSREMKNRGSKDYRFYPTRALLYQRNEVIKFFHDWKKTGIADEMINVTFNRDFYDSEQKDLIKMINMNRDHCNLFLACIPSFQTLDNQVKNLVKIRLSVVRRGVAIIQTPNRSIYSKDKWDQSINEKIERQWLARGIQNPHYTKLTTFRGLIRFPKLTPKQEGIYQKIKDDKRNIVAEEQMGINEDKNKDIKPIDKIYNDLIEGKIKDGSMLDGMGVAYDLKPSAIQSKLRNMLKNNRKPTGVASYFYGDGKNFKIKKRVFIE